ncbi:hypothetical protein V3C99_000632 [Haemonchus contortus]
MFKLHRHLTASPNTTTILADGYTDDALNSKYDNHRFSRPTSAQSGTSLGSKIRFSFDSLLSRPDPTPTDYMISNQKRFSCAQTEEVRRVTRTVPKSCLGKAKYYYDRYNCRYFAPFLLLFIYSLLGAWIFYLVEYENEVEMKLKESKDLDRLRHHSFLRFLDLFQTKRRNERASRSRDLLLWYEKELEKVKLPEALEWDMWGALFYVGTIFTTIGYGNIVPRTVTGRALSVVYAMIGIPLVLAILSRFGQFLEHTITRAWLKHREKFKRAHKKTKKYLTTEQSASLNDLEEGKHVTEEKSDFLEDHLIEDSRTIPIWLALLFCISWICACAALFLIWEKRWTFFTSLYFFFISLSTIGLGDVVPDHPHMLILMFWLVIIGLSIVSMLLTVIQIKFEECLYNFMIRMQEEYHRKLATGMPFDHEEIRKKAMEKQPLFMKLFGGELMSEEQKEKIEDTAEQFERIIRVTNNKNIQTEMPTVYGAATQIDNLGNSMACDPMSMSDIVVQVNGETQWSKQHSLIQQEPLQHAFDDDDRDSMSDATSLPLDSISYPKTKLKGNNGKKVAFSPDTELSREDSSSSGSASFVSEDVHTVDSHAQTDISQFQIDEIVLRLAALQANRSLFEDVDSEEPSLICTRKRTKKRNRSESIGNKSVAEMTDKEILTTMLHVMTQSMETDPIPQKTMKDLGVNTQQHTYVSCGVATQPVYFKSQSIETDIHDFISRSIETDDARLLEKSMETSRSEYVDAASDAFSNLSWAEKARRDMMTSPVIRRLLFKTAGTSRHSDSAEETQSKADHSQQTSLIIDRLQPAFDQEQQTSIIIDLPPRPSVDHVAVQSSPDVMEKMTAPMVALPWNYPMPASQEDMMNRSQQTSIELLNQLMARKLSVVSTSVGPDEEAESYHPGTDWNHLGSGSFYDGRMTDSIEMSTQCSPPMSRSVTTQNSRNLGVTNTRARSSSTSGLGTSIYEEENRQEVIIQTDDSYLKIARRLDEYRSNRTQFLPVVAASPLESRDIEPFKTDRPSERRGYSIEFKGLQRRCSIKPKRRMSHKIKKLFKSPSRHEKKDDNAEAQTGTSMDKDRLESALSSKPGVSRLFSFRKS